MSGPFLKTALLAVALAPLAALAQEDAPLWAHDPGTISPEWVAFMATRGQTRNNQAPAPDDIDAWTAAQAAMLTAREPGAVAATEAMGVNWQQTEIGGIPVLVITPPEVRRDDKIVVYTHGGAYTALSAKATLPSAAPFALATGLTVYSIDYTLAPHSKWQDTTDEVIAVFKGLAEQGFGGEDIVFYGDSAGGGLAAGSVLKMRDQGIEMPAALVLWSPWSDISETGDSYTTLRDAEPFYTYAETLGPSALAYADAADHQHPYVSPVYRDYTKGYPPTLIQGRIREIFLSNFVRHYQALDQAGQVVKLDLYEGMPHVFIPTLPNTIESQTALSKVRDWVDAHLLTD